MKKILMLLFAVCAIAACDPVQEDFKNDGNISVEELKAKSSVSLDKDDAGKNGNVLVCTTSAAVNAKWSIDGKDILGNYAWKKLKLGEHTVVLTGLCADGTQLSAEYKVNCDVITNPLDRFWIYGAPESGQAPFSPGGWDAAQMRFSDNEGKHFPYLTDDVYWGGKTLIFDITDATDDCIVAVMTGWWSAWFDGNGAQKPERVEIPVKNGQWELPLTEDIAKKCARGNGGEGHDLQLMITSGSCTFNNCYYEE